MTYEQHMGEYRRLHDQAMAHLETFNAFSPDTRNWSEWHKYRELSKQANRHHGVAAAMLTRALRKFERGPAR